MNLNEGVLQTFEQTEVEVNQGFERELYGLVVFKRSIKLIKHINAFFKRIMDIVGAIVGLVSHRLSQCCKVQLPDLSQGYKTTCRYQ